jgi:DNA topoisomerase-1
MHNALDHDGAMTQRDRIFATGIRREGATPADFRYRFVDGGAISAEDESRIQALRIPPAWTDVAVARSPRSKVQAIGRDAAGRWQYLYLRAHSVRRSRAKYERLIQFGEALPDLRRTLERDLRRPGLPLERTSACAVALLSTCFLRPGSQVYAHENGSFGLSTLRKRHVTVAGDRIRFDYRGKHGKRQRHEVRSRRLAAIVSDMKKRSGLVAFKYEDARGVVRELSRAQITPYNTRARGPRFSARDFRTWAGTLLCAGALSRARAEAHGENGGANGHASGYANGHAPSANGTQARRSGTARRRIAKGRRTRLKKAIAGAVRETASWLGNTPAMSRRSYIDPAVIQAFERGDVVRHALERPEVLIASGRTGLDRSEWELLLLLRRMRTPRQPASVPQILPVTPDLAPALAENREQAA